MKRKSITNFITLVTLILGILFSSLIFAETNIPSATDDFYVNDFANVFSAEEKTRIMDNAVKLSNEHNGVQVVVTTVMSLDGNTIENYALEMYNLYGIGKDDMGILILLSTGDRQIRVEVGKAMEAYIPDSKAGRFIDKYAIPFLKENKFNDGLINLQEALISQIVTDIEKDQTIAASSENEVENLQDSSSSKVNMEMLDFYIVLVSVLLVLIFFRKICQQQHEIDLLARQLNTFFNEKDAKTQELNELQSKIDTLCKEKNRLFSNYQSISDKYKDLLGRYEKVQILYPTADNEVTKMIEEEIRQRDISIAKEVDLCIQKIINLPASKDIISELEKARNCYSNLNQRQKTYVQSDINKLKLLYDESLLLKRNYDKMKKEQKEAELRRKRKKEEEEAEFRRRREEEDRRRRSHSSFGSSSHSGGHHGGFGGHSGGGGASRGF